MSILVALQVLLQAATTHGEFSPVLIRGHRMYRLYSFFLPTPFTTPAGMPRIDLHPQGVLEVQQNATAAVVCKVQHDIGQQAFTVFTWDGQRLLIGDQHFNSGLLSTDFTNCVADEGRICEEFRLTIKGVSAANGSIVGCNSTNHSTEFMADGHVEVLVTDSKPGVCAYAL